MKYDIIIIGAGVVGCSIALALTRCGYRTLNVDALPAAGYGSTSHSSAIVRPFYSHVVSAAIAHEARCRWLDWPSFLSVRGDRGLAHYHETGGLVLVRDGAEQDYQDRLRVLDEIGVSYRMLSPREILRLYPGICLEAFGPPRRLEQSGFGEPVPGRITGAIHIPACGYVSDPQLAAYNLQYAAAIGGGEFLFNTGVRRILTSAAGVAGLVTEAGATLEADKVVNAAGPHSAIVNSMAGIGDRLPIKTRAHRHEIAYLKAPEGYLDNAGFIVDLDAGVYQRPDNADMLIGSTDPACDTPDIVDPDDYNPGFTGQWTVQVYRAAQRWPALGIENSARGTVGLYDVSDDWIPVYDRTDLPGFFLAIGTSGNQFKNAPLVGDIMASIIEAEDHDRRPARLHLEQVGIDADLSFYSRNRVLQATSSVMA